MKEKFIVDKHKIKQPAAFTLAEVLITLVIIGIVAALTIPAVVVSYKKHTVETKLKTAYSMLSNVYNRYIADYGTPNYGEYFIEGTDGSSISNSIVSKYILPYLKYQSYERKTLEQHGYKNGILLPGGGAFAGPSTNARIIKLANGMSILTSVTSTPAASGQKQFYMIEYMVDIDGPFRGENTIGKDIFSFIQTFFKGATLQMYGESCSDQVSYSNAQAIANDPNHDQYCAVRNRETGETIFNTDKKASRERILEQCSNANNTRDLKTCGALIRYDGWKIKSDYPWL